MADVWCAGVGAEEYVRFLTKTLETVEKQYAGFELPPDLAAQFRAEWGARLEGPTTSFNRWSKIAKGIETARVAVGEGEGGSPGDKPGSTRRAPAARYGGAGSTDDTRVESAWNYALETAS